MPVYPGSCGTTVGDAVNGVVARMSCDGGKDIVGPDILHCVTCM